jgi:hypothetical protein
VSSKNRKVARELAGLLDTSNSVAFQKDLAAVTEQLQKDPERMASVKMVIAMEKVGTPGEVASFNTDLIGRTLNRVPTTHLTEVFFPKVLGGISKAQMKALVKADPKAAHKILYRLGFLSASDKIITVKKDEWNSVYSQRVKDMCGNPKSICWDADFNIQWQQCGHWKMLPEIPARIDDPKSHTFDSISFMGCTVALSSEDDSDMKVRGHWGVQDNWCHKSAFVQHPDRKWMKVPCFTYLKSERYLELGPAPLVAPVGLRALPAPEKQLALDNGAQSSGGGASSSGDKATPEKASSVVAEQGTPDGVPTDLELVSVAIPGERPAAPRARPIAETRRMALMDELKET